jgi:dTDP-4-dehydrorhamnose reductase
MFRPCAAFNRASAPIGPLAYFRTGTRRDTQYGRYKAEMERALASKPNTVVARTSLILTLGDGSVRPQHGKGVKFVADALAGSLPGQSGAFTMFTDELRCMSFSDELASALVELAAPACAFEGLIHLVADEVCNRYALACRLAAHFGMSDKIGTNIRPGLSAGSGMNRPLNCALSTDLLRSVLRETRIRGISERLPASPK